MRTPTYEEFLANPDAVLEAVEQAARRERAQAVHDFIVVPLKRMSTCISQKQEQRLQTESA
jgi:hypothetical protein